MKLGVLFFSAAMAAFAATTAYAEPSQEHYTAGRECYRAGLYGRALAEFEQSYAAAPSPNTQLYIARSLRELGRWAEAADHFRTTIREADERGAKYAAAREAAEAELRDVEVRIARAEPPKATTAPAPVVVVAPPPPQRLEDRAATVTSSLTTTWVSGGVALVGAASFGVLYGLASDRYAYLEDRCTRVRDAACDDARTTGRTEEGVAFVALGVAVVAAGVAIVSFVTAEHAAKQSRGRPWLVSF